jgi:hypothetical protein
MDRGFCLCPVEPLGQGFETRRESLSPVEHGLNPAHESACAGKQFRHGFVGDFVGGSFDVCNTST